ncbi:hypothetical protein GFK26_00795 [Variovorax paradoxus]|uniref:Oligosaccharide repeat unit polymerase n=1 Tax=Variovorax paradoxus TaxID=34073 RepID=A0A5Q0LW63_VARPD|nr:hypothetical protein [Variovorax paradoxus]QFZ81416.1 hypothetical protein GFK26_00795 [Variovorax paradoxus]
MIEAAELMLSILSALILGVGMWHSMRKNQDPFSPIKIYIVFNTFFYADIFFGEHNFLVRTIYLAQCLIIFICGFFEPQGREFAWRGLGKKTVNTKKMLLIVWALSVFPIATQLMVIGELGGVASAISNIALRVKYFEGRGYILIINSSFIVLNLMHFCAALISRSRRALVLYAFHFSILILIGLLSGSRSFIIMTLLVAVVIYSYIFKRVSKSNLLLVFFVFASLIAVLGELRNTVSVADDVVSFENYGSSGDLEGSHFKYGLIPLDIITSSNLSELQWGKTYLSLLTNFVPRAINSDKLESGGVFFTRVYADNAWGGDSNLATGAVTEGIINFGFGFGLIFGLVGIFAFYILGILAYRKFILKGVNEKTFMFLIPYVYFILLAARYSYSEFSYVIFSFVITVIFPWYLFRFFYGASLKFK